jgi:hypothetical protein
MELYEEVLEVLEKKYRISDTFAGSLCEDVDEDVWEGWINSYMDEYDIAECIYNGDF